MEVETRHFIHRVERGVAFRFEHHPIFVVGLGSGCLAKSGGYRCGRVGERLEPPRNQDTKKRASCGLESRRRREPSHDGVRARRGMMTLVLGGASVDVRDSRLEARFASAQRCQVVFDTLTRGFRRAISLQQPVRLLDIRFFWQSF